MFRLAVNSNLIETENMRLEDMMKRTQLWQINASTTLLIVRYLINYKQLYLVTYN